MSVCVAADIWQTYKGGIILQSSGCGVQLDHCVQVVGYNATSNYWIVRNSWGSNWGNDGYIWVEAGANVCGIAMQATAISASAALPGEIPRPPTLIPGGCPMNGCDAQLSRQLGSPLPKDNNTVLQWRLNANGAHCSATPGSEIRCSSPSGLFGLATNGTTLWHTSNVTGGSSPLLQTRTVTVAGNATSILAVTSPGEFAWSVAYGSAYPLTITRDGVLVGCKGNHFWATISSGLPFASEALNGTCASMPIIRGSRVYLLFKPTDGNNDTLGLVALDLHESLGSRISKAWDVQLRGSNVTASGMLLNDTLLVPLDVGVAVIRDAGASAQILAHLPSASELVADPRDANSVWVARHLKRKSLVLERYNLQGENLQQVDVGSMVSQETLLLTSRIGSCFSPTDTASVDLLLAAEGSEGYTLLAIAVGGATPSLRWRQSLPAKAIGQLLLAGRDAVKIVPANDLVVVTTATEILAYSIEETRLVI